MTFFPLLGAGVIAFLGRDRTSSVRWVALLCTLLTFLMTVWLYFEFDSHRAGMQFEEQYRWIDALNVRFHVGVGSAC